MPSVFAERSNIKMIGFDMIKKISTDLYRRTGLGPEDVQVHLYFRLESGYRIVAHGI